MAAATRLFTMGSSKQAIKHEGYDKVVHLTAKTACFSTNDVHFVLPSLTVTLSLPPRAAKFISR